MLFRSSRTFYVFCLHFAILFNIILEKIHLYTLNLHIFVTLCNLCRIYSLKLKFLCNFIAYIQQGQIKRAGDHASPALRYLPTVPLLDLYAPCGGISLISFSKACLMNDPTILPISLAVFSGFRVPEYLNPKKLNAL